MKWIALLLIPLVAAQGGITEVSYDPGPTRVSYSYEQVGGEGGGVHELDVVFETEGSASFEMSIESVGGQQGGVFEMDFSLVFQGLAEFKDTNGDGAYQPESDDTVRNHNLQGCWDSITTQAAGDGFDFDTTCTLAAGAGKFSIVGHVRGSPQSIAGVDVKPFETKMDFVLEDLTYLSPDSMMAVVLYVEGSTEAVGGERAAASASAEGGVTVRSGTTQTYFNWVDEADVDGVMKPVMSHTDVRSEHQQVGSGVSEFEAEGAITLAYSRGTDITHDPRLGADFSASNKGSPALPLIGLLAVLAVAAVLKRR